MVIAEKQFDRSDSSAEPSRDQLFSEFEKVKNFTTFGDYNVALVTGWALLEAITRRLVLTNRAGEVKRYLPRTIVETLVSEGLVDDGVGERLMAIVNVRNRLVHGFTGQKVQLADLNILTKVIENLLMGLNT